MILAIHQRSYQKLMSKVSRIRKYEEIYDTELARGKFKQADRESALQALMTTNLLKRLESSVESFRLTLEMLESKLTNTLQTIAKFEAGQDINVTDFTEGLENLEADEDELDELDGDTSVGGKVKISLADMDVPRWKDDLNGDIYLIQGLLTSMRKVVPEDDAKLQDIKARIADKIAHPINGNNRKILIFTAFADTANYLYRNLATGALFDNGLHFGIVTGQGTPKSTLGKHDALRLSTFS